MTAMWAHGTHCAHSEPTATTVAPEVIIHLLLGRGLHRVKHLLLDPLWPLIRCYCAAIRAHHLIHIRTRSRTSTTAIATTAAWALFPLLAYSEPTASTVAPVLLFLRLRAHVQWLRPLRPRSTDALTHAENLLTSNVLMADPDRSFPNATSAPTVPTVAFA